MIALRMLYVYQVACVGVGSLKVQLKPALYFINSLLLLLLVKQKHIINILILENIYRESEIHKICNQISIKYYKYNILRNKCNK